MASEWQDKGACSDCEMLNAFLEHPKYLDFTWKIAKHKHSKTLSDLAKLIANQNSSNRTRTTGSSRKKVGIVSEERSRMACETK